MSGLPDGFAGLEHLVERWARPTENERNCIRWAASADDFAAFHNVMLPRLNAILNELGKYPPGAMPDDVRNLAFLAAAYAEASPHHELYGGSSSVPFSFSAERFVALHGDAS